MVMTLETALIEAGYDSQWGIWALPIDGEFKLESPARYGQLIFENGGVLDDYVFVCPCSYPADARVIWCGSAEEDGDWHDGFLDELLEEFNYCLSA